MNLRKETGRPGLGGLLRDAMPADHRGFRSKDQLAGICFGDFRFCL